MKQEVIVDGMKCAGCAGSVKDRFEGLPSVNQVDVDLESKKVTLETSEVVNESALRQALEGTKYVLAEA